MTDYSGQSEFYKNGFIETDITIYPSFKRLFTLLKQIQSHKIKDGFELQVKDKYKINGKPTAYDLRTISESVENTYYDDLYKDILDEGLFDYVQSVSGRNLELPSARTRIVMPGPETKGASAIHRDGHYYKGRSKYTMPPPINLHFYPCFDEEVSDQFTYWNGTNRFQPDNVLYDKAISLLGKRTTVRSSNKSAWLVDTSGLHKACPAASEVGSFRLMYSFKLKT